MSNSVRITVKLKVSVEKHVWKNQEKGIIRIQLNFGIFFPVETLGVTDFEQVSESSASLS